MLEFIFGREMVHAVNVSDESKDVPGDLKYLAWRFINMIMAACFSFAAFVQINDPDSLVWILLYALPALICLTIVFHPLIQRKWHLKLVCIIHSIICGFGIIYSLKNGYDEILTNNSNIFAVEEAREAGGLAIVLSWLLMIAFIDSKSVNTMALRSWFAISTIALIPFLSALAYLSTVDMSQVPKHCSGIINRFK